MWWSSGRGAGEYAEDVTLKTESELGLEAGGKKLAVFGYCLWPGPMLYLGWLICIAFIKSCPPVRKITHFSPMGRKTGHY